MEMQTLAGMYRAICHTHEWDSGWCSEPAARAIGNKHARANYDEQAEQALARRVEEVTS